MGQRIGSRKLMQREAGASLEQQVRTILAHSTPPADRDNLERFLKSVMYFMREARGERLTEEEKAYPKHPDSLPIMTLLRRPEAVEGIQRRLDTILRYSISDAQRIMNLISSSFFYPSRTPLSRRQVEILLELHQNPNLHQNELAKRLRTTSRTVVRDLSQLRRDFSLQVTRRYDPQKFRLALYQILFQTKSITSSDNLGQLFRTRRPPLVRRLSFDTNLRRGYMIYLVPDQPKPYRMFQERSRALADEYFEEHKIARWQGLHLTVSFDAYDTNKGRWVLEADAIFQTLQRFGEEKYDAIQQPRGIYYSSPMSFDRIDYLLAESQLAPGQPKALELKQKLLERHGFDISLKTIWAREQRLQNSGALYTSIYFDIPNFEEEVLLSVDCTPEARETIRLFPSMLPFTYVASTDRGVTFIIQRPTLYSALTGELVRAISRISGVSDVVAFGLEQTFGIRAETPISDRWDESRQRWVLEESDF